MLQSRYSHHYCCRLNCIEEFDKYVNRLLTAPNAGEKGKVMAEAEKAFLAIPSENTNKAKADIYINNLQSINLIRLHHVNSVF